MRLTPIAALALAWLPTAAAAYQTTDQVMWPAQGIYPAYPAEEQAPARPVQFFVSGGLYHDSNLFRLSDGANTQALLGTSQRSDNIRRFGVGLKADLPISRQHLLFDARVDDFHYSTFGFLDHSQYSASATWKWQAGSRWNGDLGYARQRFLSGFGLLQLPQKNLVTESHAYASVNRLLTPRWRARGALDRSSYDYSNLAAATGALSGATPVSALDRATSLTLGGDYLTPPGNSVGAQVKLTDGRYVNPPGVSGLDNRYRETEVSGVADWHATGKSRFIGRLGYTDRRHDQVSARNFHGVTARLDYDWITGAKTLLNFAGWRELEAVESSLASYALSEGLSFGPHWAPTFRTVVQAHLFRVRRDYLGSSPERVDTVRGANVTFGYNPRRTMRFSLGLERGSQSSNIPNADYDYDLVSANARFSF